MCKYIRIYKYIEKEKIWTKTHLTGTYNEYLWDGNKISKVIKRDELYIIFFKREN